MVEDGRFTWADPFWEQSTEHWHHMLTVGVRAAYVASQHAARLMVPVGSGLIVHISSFAAQAYYGNVVCGVAKAATDKLAADMGAALSPHGVAVISLYPGIVRTETVLASGAFDLATSESPEFSGRAVAALASDKDRLTKTGQTLVTAVLAKEYGFTDLDGRQPPPLTVAQA